jgi:inner membrane protein
MGIPLVFNDLRFGQVIGWYDPREKFAFIIILIIPAKTRWWFNGAGFAKWDTKVLWALWKWIRGD